MENKCLVSSKNNIPSYNEKFIRKVEYGSGSSNVINSKKTSLFLEILKTKPIKRISQRVIVTVKPRPASITKTLYVAEIDSNKNSEASETNIFTKSFSSITAYPNDTNEVSCICINKNQSYIISQEEQSESSTTNIDPSCNNTYQSKNNDSKTFFVVMNKTDYDINVLNSGVTKVDKATLIITKSASESTQNKFGTGLLSQLSKKINYLEKKVLHQERVFRSYIAMHLSKIIPGNTRSRRSKEIYVDQYSHIPESSAFHRNVSSSKPIPPSMTTTIDKAHHSEQYGRDFTTYDGITSRGKRQCASVPLRRDRFAKVAAERVQKIRHKLNPVRDYRLMDTVHYLAQGEFAPRDDGIKLTPSREAVLSDIIWEDVCRTHWPNNRLARRERSARHELQRLIDNLLRDRVSHMERKKRKHYRIIKLNHRHESGNKSSGKTRDIIVANHKNQNKQMPENDVQSDHTINPQLLFNAHHLPLKSKNRSEERVLHKLECQPQTILRSNVVDPVPGPSHLCSRNNREMFTCCSSSSRQCSNAAADLHSNKTEFSPTNNNSANKFAKKNPRLVIKKTVSSRKDQKEVNLEHFILLPTLVVRTPSNVRRQKRFNELYHRILNQDHVVENESCSDAQANIKMGRTTSKSNYIDIASSRTDE